MNDLIKDFELGNQAHCYVLVSGDLQYLRENLKYLHEKISKEKNSLDFLEIFPGEKDVAIDSVRDLIMSANMSCYNSYKFAVINDAHNLNNYAANTLLKTLEEPPKNTVFFLLTKNLSRILPTIISRSRVYKYTKSAESTFDFKAEIEMLFNKNYVFLISFFENIHGDINSVKRFLNELKMTLYEKMRNENEKKYYAELLENTEKCLNLINANVNSRLALENLMLEF